MGLRFGYVWIIWVIYGLEMIILNIPNDDAEQPWGKPRNMIDGGVST